MSVEFYTGLQIADATGQTAPVRMRIDGNQSDEASAALQDCVNLLSNGKAIVETGEYYDYMVVQNVDPQSMRYKTYRLTLSDSVTAYKEYVYIPCANTSLLIDDPNYISPGSTLFTQVAQLIEPYYKSRLGNSCSLVAIEYIIQRNTIFPSQVGAATYAPQQVKSVTITDNGQTTIEPDSGYILGRAIVTTNVPSTETMEKSINITANGTYDVLPDTGKTLSKVTANVNVPQTTLVSTSRTYTVNGTYNITPSSGQAFNSVTVNVNVPVPTSTKFYVFPEWREVSSMTRYTESSLSISMAANSAILVIETAYNGDSNFYNIAYDYTSEAKQFSYTNGSGECYYLYMTYGIGDCTFGTADNTPQLRLRQSCIVVVNKAVLKFQFSTSQ